MLTVSHSEADAFITCERKHFYGYLLGVERVKASDAQTTGTFGHKMLEAYFLARQSGLSHKEAIEAANEYLLTLIVEVDPDIISTLKRILTQFDASRPFEEYTVLAVEKEFVLPLNDEYVYPFVVDLILRDPNGKVTIVDNKFVYDFYQQTVLNILPQIPKYVAALRAMSLPADYGIYLFLRYRKMKEQTPENTIQTVNMFLSDSRVVSSFREQIEVTNRIIERKSLSPEEQSEKAVRVSNGLVCKTCSFNSICSAELSGTNPQLVLRTEYRKRTRRVFSTKEESE